MNDTSFLFTKAEWDQLTIDQQDKIINFISKYSIHLDICNGGYHGKKEKEDEA